MQSEYTRDRCSGLIKKTGEQCMNFGKHQSKDGKMYCGRHFTEVVCNNLPNNPDNEKARGIFIKTNILFTSLFRKLAHIILLLTMVFWIHYHSKQYYYNHCESNLLKTWLFQNSSLCIGLRKVIHIIEGWSFEKMSVIARYIVMTFHELRLSS